MRLRNIKTGDEIDVPASHWEGVLREQGKYEPCQEPLKTASNEADESEQKPSETVDTNTSATSTEPLSPDTSNEKPKAKRGRPAKGK